MKMLAPGRQALTLFALTLFAAPALAGPPQKPATKPVIAKTAKTSKAAPVKSPAELAKLVALGKLPAFYDPKDLSKAPVVSAPSAILVDADTGQVLFEKNADRRMYPASTTKIMTGLLLAERTRPDDVITCTDRRVTQVEPSSLHVKMWEKFRSRDLLRGFLLRSGNDAAVMVAQHVAGSVPKFAGLMNARAREIGTIGTHFVNPHGLHDPQHYTTARDLAKIARAAMRNPRFAEAVATPSVVIARSKNAGDRRITAKVKKYYYDKFPGADGVKTGFTRKAGHCFVGSATRDGRRLISVVLHANDSASRDTIPILSWGFARFPAVTVAKRGEVAGKVPVAGGSTDSVSVVPASDLRATIDKLANPAAVVAEVQPGTAAARAPVRRGQVVGRLVARHGDKVVAEVEALAAEDVPAAPIAAAVAHTGRSWPWFLPTVGGLTLLLIGWRYGAAVTEGARRRRGRVAAAGRGTHRGG